MKHPSSVWVDPSYEQEPLLRLKNEYVQYLQGRAQTVAKETVVKYQKSLKAFIRSLERNEEPVVLGGVTPQNVNRWVTEQRKTCGEMSRGSLSEL